MKSNIDNNEQRMLGQIRSDGEGGGVCAPSGENQMNSVTTFKHDVYNIVAQIPAGRVVTYGNVARLAGWPLHSRLVGRVLSEVPDDLDLPCHRVVNSQGRLSPVFPEQRQRLEAEGVAFAEKGKVNLKKYRWELEKLEVK